LPGGDNLQLDPALPDREDGVGRIALRKDDLPPAQLGAGFAGLDLGQKGLRIDRRLVKGNHGPGEV
jgi:hypothetical protein